MPLYRTLQQQGVFTLYSSRKSLSVFMVLVLFMVVVLAACSNSTNKNAKDDEPKAPPTESADKQEITEFSYGMTTQFANDTKDQKWLPILEERTNTKVNIVEDGNGAQYYSNVDLRIAGTDFPDAALVRLAQAEVYGSQGAFVDLKPIIEEHAPHISKYMKDNPEYANLIESADGGIYGIVAEYPVIAEVIFYREDLFKKAGITTLPRTIDEFTDVLRQLKSHFGDSVTPFSGRDSFIKFAEVFNVKDRVDNGKVHGVYQNGRGMDIYSPDFLQLVEWYKTLYDEKLIDREWVAGASTEESWESKVLNSQSVISYDYYTRPILFMTRGGVESDPDYKMSVLDYLEDINGKQSKASSYFPKYHSDRVLAVNAKSKDKAVGIVKMVDYLFSEEGQHLVNWGIEGESYEMVNGVEAYTLDYATQTNTPIGEARWAFLQNNYTFPKPVDNKAFYQWNDEYVQGYASKLFTDQYIEANPILKYSTAQLQERTNLLAKVNESVTANLSSFVTGSRPISEWNTFLQEMEKAGYKKIVEIDQAAYDAMQ
jgi:putative aldouronate transport system substrate-binding protein